MAATLRLPADLQAEIKRLAAKHERSEHKEIIFALRAYVEQHKEKQMVTETTALSKTLEEFIASDDFKSGVISSTKASWGGSGYSVELLPEGTWQVHWNSQIGNRYETPGKILRLPTLDTADMAEYVDGGAGSEDDFLSEAFDNEVDDLKAELHDQQNR